MYLPNRPPSSPAHVLPAGSMSGPGPMAPLPPAATQKVPPTTSPAPTARGTGGDRATPGFGPGDAPPWDPRSNPAARPVGPTTTGRAIPVHTGSSLEVVDVGPVQRRGPEMRVPLTVKDSATGETRPLVVQFHLAGPDGAAPPSSLPTWVYAWLGGLSLLVLLALILAIL
jgi:hypothetical protein